MENEEHKEKKYALARLLPHIGMRKMKSLLAIFVGFWLINVKLFPYPGKNAQQ